VAVLPDWLNQYSCIDGSIATSRPSLTVQKCGLCHYIASLSDNWGGLICQLMIDNRERNKQNCNAEARANRTRSCEEEVQPKRLKTPIDPMLKVKAKRAVE
jgi:hypothetical protein